MGSLTLGSPDGLVVGLAPATLEFWVRFPDERNQGKQGASNKHTPPCVKVPGSSRVPEMRHATTQESAVMARRRRRRPPGGHTTAAGSGGQRAPFSTDTASHANRPDDVFLRHTRKTLKLKLSRHSPRRSERERKRVLLGTIYNGGSRASPAHGLRITTLRSASPHTGP